jgi:hypothetical protein
MGKTISVVHDGITFSLDSVYCHPENHLRTLRRIAMRELNLADRIKKNLDDGVYDFKSEDSFTSYCDTPEKAAEAQAKARADFSKARKKGLAATDLMMWIHSNNKDMMHTRIVDFKPKHVPTKGGPEL